MGARKRTRLRIRMTGSAGHQGYYLRKNKKENIAHETFARLVHIAIRKIFTTRKKIQKENGSDPTELEDTIAQASRFCWISFPRSFLFNSHYENMLLIAGIL